MERPTQTMYKALVPLWHRPGTDLVLTLTLDDTHKQSLPDQNSEEGQRSEKISSLPLALEVIRRNLIRELN